MELQSTFLNDLREKIKNEENINSCLWSLSPSRMVLKIYFDNKNLINEKKIIDIISKEMIYSSTFQILREKLRFLKQKEIEHFDNEIRVIWKKERSQEHPDGKVNIFMCCGNISYGSEKLEAFGGQKLPEFGILKAIENKNCI